MLKGRGDRALVPGGRGSRGGRIGGSPTRVLGRECPRPRKEGLQACAHHVDLSVTFPLFCACIFSRRRRRPRVKESWLPMPVTRWKQLWSKWTGSWQVRAGSPLGSWLALHTCGTVFSPLTLLSRSARSPSVDLLYLIVQASSVCRSSDSQNSLLPGVRLGPPRQRGCTAWWQVSNCGTAWVLALRQLGCSKIAFTVNWLEHIMACHS